METKFASPNAYHTPAVQENDRERNSIEHGLCTEFISLLDEPERVNSNSLR